MEREGSWARSLARWLLGAAMVAAGIVHLADTEAFFALLPGWAPARPALVVVSGVIEIALGLALWLAPARWRPVTGWTLTVFLVAVFPANVYQALAQTEAFGMRTDAARWGRLAFQPLLIACALWSTGTSQAPDARRCTNGCMNRPRGG